MFLMKENSINLHQNIHKCVFEFFYNMTYKSNKPALLNFYFDYS